MKRLAIIPFAALLALSYLWLSYIPQAVVFPDHLPVSVSPANIGMEFRNVSLYSTTDDIPLEGWWMPARNPWSAMVFVHGGSSNRHSSYFSALAFYKAVQARGISVLAIDLRNHGASGNDGKGIRFGRSEQADASAAVNWVLDNQPDLPIVAMGISMGGATLIHSAAAHDRLSGLVLLDPLLDTRSAFTGAVYAESGIPEVFVTPAAMAAQWLYAMPKGEEEALEVGKLLKLPILLIQDPDDPVTRAEHARTLASANPHVELWMAPEVAADHQELAWRKGWGTHVTAFTIYPEQTLDRIETFIREVTAAR